MDVVSVMCTPFLPHLYPSLHRRLLFGLEGTNWPSSMKFAQHVFDILFHLLGTLRAIFVLQTLAFETFFCNCLHNVKKLVAFDSYGHMKLNLQIDIPILYFSLSFAMTNNALRPFHLYGHKQLTSKIARVKRQIKMLANKEGIHMMCLRNMLLYLEAQEQEIQRLANFRQARLRRKQFLDMKRNISFSTNTIANTEADKLPTQSLQQFRQTRIRRKQLLNLKRTMTSLANRETTHASSSTTIAPDQIQLQTDIQLNSMKRLAQFKEARCRRKKLLNLQRNLTLSHILVDAYACIEEGRITWIRKHQKQLRAEVYNGLRDAINQGDVMTDSVGRMTILPSTYTGGP